MTMLSGIPKYTVRTENFHDNQDWRSLTRVDFPEPSAPTRAMILPACGRTFLLFSAGMSGMALNLMKAFLAE